MATILILANIAEDTVVRLDAPLKAATHQCGGWRGGRLGGGAANTGIPLAQAGHKVVAVSSVGDDATGGRLIGRLAASHVDVSQVVVRDGETARALVMVDPSGERTVVSIPGAAQEGPPERLRSLFGDWLYVKNRDVALAPLLAEKARGLKVLAHVPPCAAGCRPAHVLVGSQSDLDDDFLADPVAAGRRIAGDVLEWVVVTAGAEGARAWHVEGETVARPAPPVRPVDTTGAGDAFAAGLLHGLASGAGMHRAMDIAVRWGSAAVACESSVPEIPELAGAAAPH